MLAIEVAFRIWNGKSHLVKFGPAFATGNLLIVNTNDFVTAVKQGAVGLIVSLNVTVPAVLSSIDGL